LEKKARIFSGLITSSLKKIVFLDEPTGKIQSLRQFWEMIYAEAHKGRHYLTTHYMMAEYCDRVSIMVEGRIEALDTPTNLKNSMG
jgi:ABC-2 type transport system ATP-binding protein